MRLISFYGRASSSRRVLLSLSFVVVLLWGGATTTTTTTTSSSFLMVTAFRATPLSVTRKTSFLAAPPPASSTTTRGGIVTRRRGRRQGGSSTGLSMFMGSDGGLLGVGTPEVFTVLLVGYFVLGPSDLYKLTKEIGKFVQNIRTLGDDLTTTLETNMESQLQLEEIRKAQRELNDAFSFRRSINTDDTGDAFSTTVDSPRPGVTAVQDDDATTTAVVAEDDNDAGDAGSGGRSSVSQGGTTTKKKIRRRVKRKAATPTEEGSYNGNVPTDLDMPSAANKGGEDRYADRPQDPFIEFTDEEQKKIDQEFDQYVSLGDDDDKDPTGSKDGWFGGDSSATDGDAKPTLAAGDSQQQQQQATSRFQQQLSGDWNAQVMANEDRLEPLAKVMQLLASLEEEKISSTKRLEEEFRRRAEVEEEYYQKQRKLLEDAAAQVQQATAGSTTTTTTSTTSSQTSTNSKR